MDYACPLEIAPKLKDSTVVFPAPIIYGITIHHRHGWGFVYSAHAHQGWECITHLGNSFKTERFHSSISSTNNLWHYYTSPTRLRGFVYSAHAHQGCPVKPHHLLLASWCNDSTLQFYFLGMSSVYWQEVTNREWCLVSGRFCVLHTASQLRIVVTPRAGSWIWNSW